MHTRRIVAIAAFGFAIASVGLAWAQIPNVPVPVAPLTGAPAPSSIGDGAMWLTAIVLLALVVLVAGTAKLFDLRRKRQAEAVHLQAQVSDALLRDPALFGLPITPTAYVPTWRGSPVVLEVSGRVPSPELRKAVLRIARAEAARVRADVRIEDRLAIAMSAAPRAA